MNIIDISSNNHPHDAAIDWRKVRAAGVDGAYIKATEGTTYVNPWFGRDVQGAKAAGLQVGAYHFAQPSAGAAGAQAVAFIQTADRYQLDLPHALDLEDGARLGWNWLAAWARGWLDHPLIAAGDPAVYVNRNYLERLPGCPWNRLLWLADWHDQPRYPCWLWQHGSGPVDGIAGPVDLDTLMGAPGPATANPGRPGRPPLPIVDRPAPPPAQFGQPLEVNPDVKVQPDFYPNPNPLDANGHGYLELPVPFAQVLAVEVQGPAPDQPPHGNGDGYWPPVHIETTNHDGQLLVTFYGAPGQASGVWVRHLVD